MAQTVKHLSTVRETWVRSLGREDPLEKEMAAHSSIVAWEVPWAEEAGYSPWGLKESDTTERPHCLFHFTFTRKRHFIAFWHQKGKVQGFNEIINFKRT